MQNGFVHESGLLYYVQQVSHHNLPVPTGAKARITFIRAHTTAFFFFFFCTCVFLEAIDWSHWVTLSLTPRAWHFSFFFKRIVHVRNTKGSYAVWLNDTIHRRQRWFACCFYAGNFPPATSGSGYTIMSARGLDKRPGGEIVSSNGQKKVTKWLVGFFFFFFIQLLPSDAAGLANRLLVVFVWPTARRI